MALKEKYTKEKINGAVFTPPDLASFLSSRLHYYLKTFKKSDLVIWDPACGDGNLIQAALEKFSIPNVSIFGTESNVKSLDIAKERFKNFKNIKIIDEDFLQYYSNHFGESSLFNNFKTNILNPNGIIANPPYVRTQVMGSNAAQELAKQFSLAGRVDLYFAFLIGMVKFLQDDGILVVITSNRFLYTRSGESIRRFLSSNLEILELYDLGDTKFFKAAVLPAILVARKTSKIDKSKIFLFSKIYETVSQNSPKTSVNKKEELLQIAADGFNGVVIFEEKTYKIDNARMTLSKLTSEPWSLENPESPNILLKKGSFSIKNFFKVKVGIKTTADKVFIRSNWDDLELKPEQILLHSLISSSDIQKWFLPSKKTERQILYPYKFESKRKPIDISNYPHSEKYLSDHRLQLESRKYLIEAGREWFEIWVPHNPLDWKYPKIVFPDISCSPNFMYDNDGFLVNGNCYWISAKTDEEIKLLYLIMGVANSKFMEHYYDNHFGNKLYSGKRRFLTQYVEKFPIPDPDSSLALNIMKTVENHIIQKSTKVLEFSDELFDYFKLSNKN
jgi:tRNA1(Val) A37 N6-methylase TrmN6